MLRADCSFIAITERVGKGFTFCVQSNVVHRPPIRGNGADALARNLGAFAQADIHLLRNLAQVPTDLTVMADRSLWVAMNQLDMRRPMQPPEQRYPAAFRTEIDRDHRAPVFWAVLTHRRYASVRPPSTGIRR